MTSDQDQFQKIDVAVNIFAKPFQTALSLISLLDRSGSHIGRFWLQYEPVGSRYDYVNPYAIAEYLGEQGWECQLSQPDKWLDLEATTEEMLQSYAGRQCIRYENAFENCQSKYLFIMHNDILVLKDVIGDLKANIGDAFAIGQLGQCWNCPAANDALAREVMGRPACGPEHYGEFRPDYGQLCQLYGRARELGVFVRPYDTDNFRGEFEKQPWPLPECRINEWACLINLELARPCSVPHGKAWPFGSYRKCGSHNLDIGAPFFRDMHAQGFKARHFPLKTHLRHWVGTGNNTPLRYAHSEDRAKRILEKHYPDYMAWLKKREKKI